MDAHLLKHFLNSYAFKIFQINIFNTNVIWEKPFDSLRPTSSRNMKGIWNQSVFTCNSIRMTPMSYSKSRNQLLAFHFLLKEGMIWTEFHLLQYNYDQVGEKFPFSNFGSKFWSQILLCMLLRTKPNSYWNHQESAQPASAIEGKLSFHIIQGE